MVKNYQEKIKKNWEIICVFIGAFLIRVYNLNFLNIWRDESFSINVASFPFIEVIKTAANDTQPPLHLTSLHFWMNLFGDSAISVRMLSVIFGMITIFFGFLIAKKIFENKKYTLIATILIAINPLLVFYSQEARAYSMLTGFTAGAVYFAIIFDKDSNWKNILGFILFSVGGLYTHNIFLFVLSTIILLKFSELLLKDGWKLKILWNNNKQFIIKFILSLFGVGIFYLPWFIVFLSQFNKVDSGGFWLGFNPIQDVLVNTLPFFTSSHFEQNFSIIDEISMFIIGLFGVPLAILGMIKEIQDRKNKFPYLSFLTIGMLGTVWLISFKLPFYYIRYLIFVTPFILLLFVYGLRELKFIIGRNGINFIAIIFLLSTLFLQLTNVAQNFNAKADYQGATSYIEYNEKTDLVMHGNALTLHSFIYYSDIDSFLYDPERKMEYWQGLAYLTDENYYDDEFFFQDRIWVMYMWPYSTLEEKLSEQNYTKTQSKEFNGGLKVDLWEKDKSQDVSFAGE